MLVNKIRKKLFSVSVSLKMEKRHEVTHSDAEEDFKFKVPPNDLLLELQLLLQELSYRADHPNWENERRTVGRGQTFTVDKEAAAEKVKKWEKKLPDHHRMLKDEIISQMDNAHLPPGPSFSGT